jgi:hypothetical protein
MGDKAIELRVPLKMDAFSILKKGLRSNGNLDPALQTIRSDR